MMVILIAGASHTGKTYLAQRLLEKWHYPYLSIDHLKMGLIRSGYTRLSPLSDDDDLTAYLWPVVREMIRTALENGQNLIVEGCYIPFDWQKNFAAQDLPHMRFYCLAMSERYIKNHFAAIKAHACVIENRLDDAGCTLDSVLNDNRHVLEMAQKHHVDCVLIDENYEQDIARVLD